MQSRALVTGASIAGLSTAFWLARAGWSVQVVERAPGFRTGGQNVDVRGTARDVLERMGLTAAVRERNTTEEGTAFIGARGLALGRIPADREQDGPTAELEVLRGDLARILLDALPDSAPVRFGDQLVAADTHGDGVSVQWASGLREGYDLVVIAEGVRSRSRDLVFGAEVDRRPLGLNMAYGTVSRQPGDDRWWRWYTAAGRRGITLRPDREGTIRATLAFVDDDLDLGDVPVDEAIRILERRFAGAGWEADRVVEGYRRSDDVYVDYLTQIRMPSWSKGRICVTGDAAWCVTPLGGGGASLALIGGYVLASSVAHHDTFDRALRQYEEWMRPLVEEGQRLPRGTPDAFYPASSLGVAALRTAQALLTTRPFRSFAARMSHVARTDQDLPPTPA